MAVQTRTDYTNKAFVLSGEPATDEAATLLQDAGRGAVALEEFTLMSQVSASGKWVPFTNEAATNGTQIPAGIILATVTGAELVAGDVVDIPILVGIGITIDGGQLVIENSKTLATVITDSTLTVKAELRRQGIFTESVIDIDGFEN